MSVKGADPGTNLNDAFGGGSISVDTGAGDDWQNGQVEEPATTTDTEAKASDESSTTQEASETESEGSDPPETPAPAAAPPSPPSPSSVQATPPPEPPPWFEQTMAPIQRYFQEQAALIKAGMQRKAQQDAIAQRQAENQARLQAREASKPVPPNPATATVADLNDYANNLARWHAAAAREDAEFGLRGEIQALQSKMEELNEYNRRAALDAQARANADYITNSVEAFANDSRFPFMQTEHGKDLFLGQWWAMNNAAGKFISAGEAMSKFMSMLAAVNSPKTSAAQTRNAQEALDQKRREEQSKLGVPPAPKGGPPSTKTNQGGTLEDKPWWENGALH